MDYIIDLNSNLSYINNDYLNDLKYKNINKIIIKNLYDGTYDIYNKLIKSNKIIKKFQIENDKSELSLYNNQIEDISSLQYLTNLKKLDLYYNKI